MATQQQLEPASELAKKNVVHFPNESNECRLARKRGWRHLKLYSDVNGD